MSEEYFKSMIDETTGVMAYVATIDTYELLYVNEAILASFSETLENLKGKKCYKFLQGRDEPCPFCTNKKLKVGEVYKWKFYNPILEVHLSLRDTLVEVDGRPLRLETAYDITDEMMKIDNLQNILNIEDSIVSCATSLLKDDKIDDALNKIVETVMDYYEADKAYIYEINEKENMFYNTYACYSKYHTGNVVETMSYEDVQTFIRRLKRGEEIYVGSVDDEFSDDTEVYRILKQQNLEGFVVMPLHRGTEMVGLLGVTNPHKGLDDSYLLKTLAAFVMSNLNQRYMTKKLNEKIAETEEALKFTNAVLDSATKLLNEDDVKIPFGDLLETICEYYGAEATNIFEMESEETVAHNTHRYVAPNAKGHANKHDLPLDLLMKAGEFTDDNGVLYISSLENMSKAFQKSFEVLEDGSIHNLIIKPLTVDNKKIGYLSIVNFAKRKVDYKFIDVICAAMARDLL
ncbi:MAG: GAF domain-containing protein [Bacillota bacterium]